MFTVSMETTITATQAKVEFLGIIDRVANGRSGPITVTKHGKARVMIVPIVEEFSTTVLAQKGYGALRGLAVALQGYDYEPPVLDEEPSDDDENLGY